MLMLLKTSAKLSVPRKPKNSTCSRVDQARSGAGYFPRSGCARVVEFATGQMAEMISCLLASVKRSSIEEHSGDLVIRFVAEKTDSCGTNEDERFH